MEQCKQANCEESDSWARKNLRKENYNKYPWFTVLIADGVKDSTEQIFYLNRGTRVIINGELPAITGHRNENIFGAVEVVEVGNQLKARFIKCDAVVEALMLDLTPSVNVKVYKVNGAFVEVVEIKAISFDFARNCDHRIKSVRLQREDQDASEVKCNSYQERQ